MIKTKGIHAFRLTRAQRAHKYEVERLTRSGPAWRSPRRDHRLVLGRQNFENFTCGKSSQNGERALTRRGKTGGSLRDVQAAAFASYARTAVGLRE